MLVGAHPISKVASRKDPNMASDGRQRGAALERSALGRDPIAVHPIVGVHARHELPAAMFDTL
jgi:hypothetical protein